MSISSLDILNLSHSLKDVCETDCGTCPALTDTLRALAQINLIRAQLEFGRQFDRGPDGTKQAGGERAVIPEIEGIVIQ